MRNQEILTLVPKKLVPFSKILIIYNCSIDKNVLYIFLYILLKYIPLIAMASNFQIDFDIKYKNNYSVADILRIFTLFNIQGSITPLFFYITSFCLYLYNACFCYYWIKFYYYIKKGKNNLDLGKFGRIIFYLSTLFGQYMLEFFSFSIFFMFRNTFTLPNEEIFNSYANCPMLKETSYYNKPLIYFTGIVNIISYILVNIFLIFTGLVLNSPFHMHKIAMNFYHNDFNFFLIFTSNVYAIHYYEFFLPDNTRIIFKGIIYGLFIFSSFVDSLSNLYKYEKETNIFYVMMKFFHYYIVISMVVEIIIGCEKKVLTNTEIVVIIIAKLIMSTCLLVVLFYYKRRTILKLSSTLLFEQYEANHLNKIIEVYHFLIDKLMNDDNHYTYFYFINIIEEHQRHCDNENCKCKYIKIFQKNSSKNNKDFEKWFIMSMGFYLESTFTSITSLSNMRLSFLLSDYYFIIKKNPLFAISIVQSAISTSHKRSCIDILFMFSSFFHYIEQFDEINKNNKSIVHFQDIYQNIEERFEFTKNILKYCNIIETLIDIKTNFENSIKIITDPDTKELIEASSIFLNRSIIHQVMNHLKKITNKGKRIKKYLVKCSSHTKTVDFYYLCYLFYIIFDSKIPYKIKHSFSKIEITDNISHLSEDKIGEKLECYLDKYLSSEYSTNQIILKCSKGIKIQYFSSNLCSKLGYSAYSMRGEDFNSILPKNIRDLHTKAMLNHLMNKKEYIFNGSTHLFDVNFNILPCKIKGCALPNLSKSLLIICEIELSHNNKMLMMLDSSFHTVSISKEIEKRYYLNLNFLKQTDTELLEILDVDSKDIKKYFKKTLTAIDTIKKELELHCIEAYSRLLFYSRLSEDSDKSERKFILSQESFNMNNSVPLFLRKVDLFDDKSKREIMYMTKARNVIIQNIINTLYKLTDSSMKEETLNKLNETLYAFQHSLTYMTSLEGKKTETKPLKSHNRISVPNISTKHFELNKTYKVASKISIKIKIKKLYDSPIYIIEIKDNTTFDTHIQKNPSSNEKDNKKVIRTSKKRSTKRKQSTLYRNGVTISRENFKHSSLQRSEKNISCERKSLIILIVLIIGLTIANIIVQSLEIGKAQDVFDFLYESYFQRDKIIYLQSTLFYLLFEVGEYSQMNITDQETFEYLDTTSQSLEESLITLYQSMITYNKQFTFENFTMVQNQTFYKVVGNWEPISYQSDYFSEISYALYLTNVAIREDDLTNMKKDIKLFFFSKYLSNPRMKVYSPFGQVLYYINMNINYAIGGIVSTMIAEVSDEIKRFLSHQTLTSLTCLCVLYVMLVIFLAITHIVFKKYNIKIFKIVVGMFFDPNLHAKKDLANKKDNYYMKQLVKSFIQLVRNFNEDNRKVLKELQSDTTFNPSLSSLYPLATSSPKKNYFFDINSTLNSNVSNSNALNLSSNANQTNQSLLTNSSILESKNNLIKSNKASNLKLSMISPRKKEQQQPNIAITNMKLIKLLSRQNIQTELGIFYVIYGFLIVLTIVFILNVLYTNDFHTFITFSEKMFNAFTNYYYSLSLVLNSIRKTIARKGTPTAVLTSFIDTIFEYKREKEDMKNERNMKYYKELKKLISNTNLPANSTSIDLNFLCNSDKLCIRMLNRTSGYCSLGIVLGTDLITQKYIEIVAGYKQLLIDHPLFGEETLKKFLYEKEFDRVQENVDLILSQTQNQLYFCFRKDFESHIDYMKRINIIINSAIFAIEFIAIVLVSSVIIQLLKHNVFMIEFGAEKFNTAFYKNVKQSSEKE